MRRKRIKKEASESKLPMDSMIDVVFLLLIYFILVSKPVIEETLFETKLPGGRGPTAIKKEPPLAIEVNRIFKSDPQKDLEYYTIQGKIFDIKAITQLLESSSKHDKDRTLLISCGPNARHEKLIRLLDLCTEAKIENLSVVNNAAIAFESK